MEDSIPFLKLFLPSHIWNFPYSMSKSLDSIPLHALASGTNPLIPLAQNQAVLVGCCYWLPIAKLPGSSAQIVKKECTDTG